MTKEELFSLKPKNINCEIYEEARRRWDSISKPLDGLGDFEKVVSKILSINESLDIDNLKKVLVIMCADHGIVEEGVSQCGSEVTLSVAKLLGENRSTASKMAAFAGVDCVTVDVGINSLEKIAGVRNLKVRKGTDNFLKEEAMSEAEAIEAIEVGIQLAKECKENGYHILATGEMGIGNTTSGTAVLCGLTGIEARKVVGRGAGLSDEGLKRKLNVITLAIEKYKFNVEDSKEYALKVMSNVGGLELASMAGLFIGGAVYGIPVMIDGALSAVSALFSEIIVNGSKDYMIPSHKGREKGTEYVLQKLNLRPLINGDMALGEGTGALMAMPLIDMAFDFYKNATTFCEGNIKQYKRL